jgi:hypothetical protein
MKTVRTSLLTLSLFLIIPFQAFSGTEKIIALAEMARDGFQGFAQMEIEELKLLPFHLQGMEPSFLSYTSQKRMKYSHNYLPDYGADDETDFMVAQSYILNKYSAEGLAKDLEEIMGVPYTVIDKSEKSSFGYSNYEFKIFVVIAEVDKENWEEYSFTELQYPAVSSKRSEDLGLGDIDLEIVILGPKNYFPTKHSHFAWMKFPGIPDGVTTRTDHDFFGTPRKVKTIKNPGKPNEVHITEHYNQGGIYTSYSQKGDIGIDTFSYTVHPDGYIDYTHWFVTMAFEEDGEPEVMIDIETFYGPDLFSVKVLHEGIETEIENTLNDRGLLILKKKGKNEYNYEYEGLLKSKEIKKFYGEVEEVISYKYDLKGRLIRKEVEELYYDKTVIDTIMYDDQNMTRTEARVTIEDDGTETAVVTIYNEYNLPFYSETYENDERTSVSQMKYEYDPKGNWNRKEVYTNEELTEVETREIDYWQ